MGRWGAAGVSQRGQLAPRPPPHPPARCQNSAASMRTMPLHQLQDLVPQLLPVYIGHVGRAVEEALRGRGGRAARVGWRGRWEGSIGTDAAFARFFDCQKSQRDSGMTLGRSMDSPSARESACGPPPPSVHPPSFRRYFSLQRQRMLWPTVKAGNGVLKISLSNPSESMKRQKRYQSYQIDEQRCPPTSFLGPEHLRPSSRLARSRAICMYKYHLMSMLHSQTR